MAGHRPASTWVDVGAGTGIAMSYVWLFHQFASVQGIEISHNLVAIGKKNLNHISARESRLGQPNEPQLDQGDGREHKLAKGEYTIFMFNPFGPETLRGFLSNNSEILSESSSRLLIANDKYLLPRSQENARILERDEKFHLSMLGF